MCVPEERASEAQQTYLDELLEAGLLIPTGVPGLYGRSGVFEGVLESFDRFVTRCGADAAPEVIRFPPLFSRRQYVRTDHLDNFPQLMGSVHSFTGSEREHRALVEAKQNGGNWAGALSPTDVMLTPATCYPLYPTATGTLPAGGRTVDLQSYNFRHEPSADPARMQAFRIHEFVRLGSPRQAIGHRDHWLERGLDMLRSLGLDVKAVPANDPFFGRGARIMAATQKEQSLKFELVVPVASAEKPTAVASSNLHLDLFGRTFGIRTADGEVAHTACVGFGLERVTLALFRAHSFDPGRWPAAVKQVLEL